MRVLLETLVAVHPRHQTPDEQPPVPAEGFAVSVPSARAVEATRDGNDNPSEGTCQVRQTRTDRLAAAGLTVLAWMDGQW